MFLKAPKNVSTYFNHYCEFLVTLKLIWGNIEKSSNFWEMFFSMSIFNRETIGIVLFQLQSYKFTKDAKFLKKNFFQSFLSIFGGSEITWGNTEEQSYFQQLFYFLHILYIKIFGMVILHLQTTICSRKSKNVEQCKFLVVFVPFPRPWNDLRKYWKLYSKSDTRSDMICFKVKM